MSIRRPLANRARRSERNPLRRRIDDVETALMTGIVALFFVAAPPLSVLTGRLADSAALREQRAERTWHPVAAVLEQNASAGMIGQDGVSSASWVEARWILPDGRQRTGVIAVGLAARAGDRVTEWVTESGQLTHSPLGPGEVIDAIVNAVLATVGAVGALLALVAMVARIVIRRRRFASWAREWKVTGPHWRSPN